MMSHLAHMSGLVALIALCIVYPFLPGAYDSLAMPLSTMAQAFGGLGVVVVAPVGVSWLAYESWKQSRLKRRLAVPARGYYFAVGAAIAASLVAVAVALVGFAAAGLSLGLLAFALWVYTIPRVIRGLKRLRNAEGTSFNPVPLYLVFVPVALMLFQLTLATPATEFSRGHAIGNAAELINTIEGFRDRHGDYPRSLSAVWQDYDPSVVGIDRYYYAPNRDAYDLYFEQPRFLFDNLGTREFVMYNKREQHGLSSHTAWVLLLTPEQLERSQGWYAVHDGPRRHWKYFWFD